VQAVDDAQAIDAVLVRVAQELPDRVEVDGRGQRRPRLAETHYRFWKARIWPPGSWELAADSIRGPQPALRLLPGGWAVRRSPPGLLLAAAAASTTQTGVRHDESVMTKGDRHPTMGLLGNPARAAPN